MRWTPEANALLAERWENHSDKTPYDDFIMGKLLGTTASAVAKQRSNIGLVAHKVPFHNRKAKVDKPKQPCAPYVLHYNRDGGEHFMSIREGDGLAAQGTARRIMLQLGLRELTILQPIRKMVMQGITEVDLTKQG